MLAGWKRPEQKKRSQVLNIKHRSSRLISGTDGLDVGHYIKAGAGEPHSSAANGKLIGGRGALLRKGRVNNYHQASEQAGNGSGQTVYCSCFGKSTPFVSGSVGFVSGIVCNKLFVILQMFFFLRFTSL